MWKFKIVDDGNMNPHVYGNAPKGDKGIKGSKGYGSGGVGSNNPTPYGSKPSFGDNNSRMWRTNAGGQGTSNRGK